MSIPIYSAAGKRLDVISQHELARLEAAGKLARVVRRRDGSPARAYLLPRDYLESPCDLSALIGQRYSYRERLTNCRVWTLKRMGLGDELRPVFLAVLKSCLKSSDAVGESHGSKSNHHHHASTLLLNGAGAQNAIRTPK